jgi:hypothetical protein
LSLSTLMLYGILIGTGVIIPIWMFIEINRGDINQ